MISIIIPLYNTEKYISETIHSVLNQTEKNWELIVIDDGSTDTSEDIVKLFCEKDDRISYYFQENSGVSEARNFGIIKSKGDYVCFLDSDDVWKEDNLTERMLFFKNNKKIDWIYGDLELIDEKSTLLNSFFKGRITNNLESLLLWDGKVITAPSSITVKRECLVDCKFDNILSTAADQDFAIQLASKYNGMHFPKALVLYRVLENSMSRNIFTMEKDHIAVYKKALKNNLFKSFWFKQKCFSNLYWILAGSFWKDANNKIKSFIYIIKAIVNNPISILEKLK